jgi:cytochrome c553
MLRIRIIRFSTIFFAAAAAVSAQGGYRFFDPAIADSIPKLISGTGMYKNMATKEFNADVIPFEVNAPLWTDGAFKQRYVAMPAGSSIVYDDTADTYAYPDRAMVIKNFSVDTIPGNPASRILFETRFSGVRIVAGKEKWYLWTYHWRLDQTDADLVVDVGENATVRVYRNGANQPPFMKKWRFPSKAQCAACHRVQGTGGRTVLAFFTAQLNKPLDSAPAVNQLDHLFNLGVLKSKDGTRPDFAKAPKWANWADNTASLEVRARSYIAANCSGCHGTRGNRTGAAPGTTLDYDYHDMKPHMDFTAKKLAGVFPLDSAGLVVPGKPERSVLLYRQKMRNQLDLDFRAEPMAMPPLGSFEPDTNAIAMMSQWIVNLGGTAIRAPLDHASAGAMFRVKGGYLERIGHDVGSSESRIHLVDLKGASVELEAVRQGVYPLPQGIKGIRFLAVDGRIVQRMVF